jgi:hypothetical protein
MDDSDVNNGIYWCKIDEDVENYLYSINPSWTTARNYKMKIQNPISMIDGINDKKHVFKVDVYANQYIKVIYGTSVNVIPMNQRLEDNTWYGIVVNLGNSWSQLNAHVWTSSNSNFADKLTSVFTKTVSLPPSDITITNYSINKSDAYLTNIRLFKTTVEDEKQTLELLSYLSKDADQAIILDNADEKFMNPYISRQR